MTRRSIQLPAFDAAMTPKGMAKLRVMMRAITVSDTVGPTR